MVDKQLELFRRQVANIVATEKTRTNVWLARMAQASEVYMASLLENSKLRIKASARDGIKRAIQQHVDFIASIPADLPEIALPTVLASSEETLQRTVANIQTAADKTRRTF